MRRCDVLQVFDEVRVINLVERIDRREQMQKQLRRCGADDARVSFYDAEKPKSLGGFPSTGARGCFESHLAVLRAARDRKAKNVLIIEDDFDFTREGLARAPRVMEELFQQSWDVFYGAHLLLKRGRSGIALVPPDEPVMTASFVAFQGSILASLIDFLEAMLRRPPGSPEYGPMHVDGAYSVFRASTPHLRTFAVFPPIGRQRSSRSDITPNRMVLDKWPWTRHVASMLRQIYNGVRP